MSGIIGTVGSRSGIIQKKSPFTGFSILDADFVNGGGFGIAFSNTIPSTDCVANGTTKLLIQYSLINTGGGSSPTWRYTITGGITVGETEIGSAAAGTITGNLEVDIPAGMSTNVVVNIGTARAGGGANTAKPFSTILLREILR
tara:strand:+ start:49 stop:480 length:432 start_codon:yes stop_codon:yes gene_type:complete